MGLPDRERPVPVQSIYFAQGKCLDTKNNNGGESIMEKLKVFLASQESEEQSGNQENEWDCWIEKGWSQF